MNAPDRIQPIKLGSKSKFDQEFNELYRTGAINNSFGYVQNTTTGDIPLNSNSYTLTTALSQL